MGEGMNMTVINGRLLKAILHSKTEKKTYCNNYKDVIKTAAVVSRCVSIIK